MRWAPSSSLRDNLLRSLLRRLISDALLAVESVDFNFDLALEGEEKG